MKNLIYILSIVLLASCNSEPKILINGEEVEAAVAWTPADVIVDTTVGSGPKIKDNNSLDENKPFSNPAIIYGSDFGNYFRTLYKLGKYDEMISFTSSQSIEQFGEEAIIEFYKNDLDFGYEIGKPHSKNISGNIITLNYEADIFATKKVVRIDIIIENDSCKIVLPNKLNNFPS